MGAERCCFYGGLGIGYIAERCPYRLIMSFLVDCATPPGLWSEEGFVTPGSSLWSLNPGKSRTCAREKVLKIRFFCERYFNILEQQ